MDPAGLENKYTASDLIGWRHRITKNFGDLKWISHVNRRENININNMLVSFRKQKFKKEKPISARKNDNGGLKKSIRKRLMLLLPIPLIFL